MNLNSHLTQNHCSCKPMVVDVVDGRLKELSLDKFLVICYLAHEQRQDGIHQKARTTKWKVGK